MFQILLAVLSPAEIERGPIEICNAVRVNNFETVGESI